MGSRIRVSDKTPTFWWDALWVLLFLFLQNWSVFTTSLEPILSKIRNDGNRTLGARESKTIFAGRKGFALPRLFFQNGGDFVFAAQEGARGMRGGFFFDFLGGGCEEKKFV